MDPVRKSLNEVEGMMSTLKANREDTAIVIDLARARTNISRRQVRQSVDRFIIDEHDWLNKNSDKEYKALSRELEQTVATRLRQGLTDAHGFIWNKIETEHSISNTAYLDATEKYDAHIKHEEETMTSIVKQLEEQFDWLMYEHSKLKSLMESWIEQEAGRHKNEVEVTTVLY